VAWCRVQTRRGAIEGAIEGAPTLKPPPPPPQFYTNALPHEKAWRTEQSRAASYWNKVVRLTREGDEWIAAPRAVVD